MLLYYMAKIHPQLQWDRGQWVDLTDVGRNAHTMAQTIIDKGLANKITEYYGIEATLYYPCNNFKYINFILSFMYY